MAAEECHNRRRALALLQRVVAAGLGDRFQLRKVCPHDAATHIEAFENLVEWGYVERVTERVGVWYYRLTPRAHAAIAGEPLLFGEGYLTPDREHEPTRLGWQ